MKTIQNILADGLNGFSLDQIPFFIFQIICAGLLAHVFQFLLNKKTGESTLKYSALIAAGVAILAAIVKYNEPMAILGAAVILLLFRSKEKSQLETIGQMLVVLFAVGCGVGSVIPTIIGGAIVCSIVLFIPVKK